MGEITSQRNARLKYILDKVDEQGILKTEEICQELKLSVMTISRDFNYICNSNNKYERFYGGLKKRGSITDIEKFFIRWDENRNEKIRIAKKTSELLKSGERILLAPGTTTFYIAEEICERSDLVVLTNSLPIASLLPAKSQLVVIFIGGSIISGELDTHNFDNLTIMKELRINKVILGAWGIDAEKGITTSHPEGMNRIFMENSDETIIVADHTKFGISKQYKVADIDEVDYIITTELTPETHLNNIRKKGGEIIIA